MREFVVMDRDDDDGGRILLGVDYIDGWPAHLGNTHTALTISSRSDRSGISVALSRDTAAALMAELGGYLAGGVEHTLAGGRVEIVLTHPITGQRRSVIWLDYDANTPTAALYAASLDVDGFRRDDPVVVWLPRAAAIDLMAHLGAFVAAT